MKFAHNMIRVRDLEKALNFWCNIMDFEEVKRSEYERGRFSLVFLKQKNDDLVIELTHNWDHTDDYTNGTNFGHIAFYVDDIYNLCEKFQEKKVDILRPPRDGRMAFIKSPNNISIEFLQVGEALDVKEPWLSMMNQGSW